MGNCKRRQGSVYFRTKNEQSVVATCIKYLREKVFSLVFSDLVVRGMQAFAHA